MTSLRRNDTPAPAHPNGASPEARSPVITSRSRLPNTRAVVGGLLVTASALGLVTVAGRNTSQPSTYVVARHDLELGARLTADDLRLAAIDLPPAQATRALRDIRLAAGSVVVAPLARGELLQRSALAPATQPELPVEVSVPVSRARAVNGRLVAGEPVTVLGTFGTGESAVTRAVVRDARVVQIHSGDGGFAESADVVLTLAVATTADGIAISHASQAAEITIMRGPTDAGAGAEAEADSAPPTTKAD